MTKTLAQLDAEDIGAQVRFEAIGGDVVEGTLTGFGSGQVGEQEVQHKIHLYRDRRFYVAEDVEVEFIGEDADADEPVESGE